MPERINMTLIVVACICLSFTGSAWAVSSCIQGDAVHIWSAPLVARPGEKLEIVAVATDGELSELVITDPTGRHATLLTVKAGGPPWSLRGALAAPAAGNFHIEARRAGQVVACSKVEVGGKAGKRGNGEWNLATQALYATWVEHLFDAPPQVSLSFPSLEPLLRDPNRNFLYDFLRKGEDTQFPARPDCADLSFFLRGRKSSSKNRGRRISCQCQQPKSLNAVVQYSGIAPERAKDVFRVLHKLNKIGIQDIELELTKGRYDSSGDFITGSGTTDLNVKKIKDYLGHFRKATARKF